MPEGGEGKPITMIKPEHIVITAAKTHSFLIKQLDNNTKLPIRGSNLVTGIIIMTNHDKIILSAQCNPINTEIVLAALPGTYTQIVP
jgi:hypothetical protein